MDHFRHTFRSVWRHALLVTTLVALLAVVAPNADAGDDANISEPVPDVVVTIPLPTAPTACAQPGAPILPDPDVSATFIQSGSFGALYPAANAFDGAPSMWLSELWEDPAWVGVRFDDSYLVTSYDVTFSNGRLRTRAPRDWTLEGSRGDEGWTVVDTRTDQTDWNGTETRSFTVQNPSDFDSYRLHITQDNADESAVVVASVDELALFTDCPAPDVRVQHTLVPFGSDCPANFNEAQSQALAAAGGATESLEASHGAAVRFCINVRNMGPGVAGTVTFDHPLFSNTSFTNIAVGSEGAAEVVRTVRYRNAGVSTVVANATDVLGNSTSQDEDSVELVVTQGFELRTLVVDDNRCPNQAGDVSQLPQATEVVLGSEIAVCIRYNSLSAEPAAELRIVSSLLDSPRRPNTGLVAGITSVDAIGGIDVTADLAGATTVGLELTNEIGGVTAVQEVDVVLVVVDG